MKLVYGITVSTELKELKNLIDILITNTDDEIIVLTDKLTVTNDVLDFLNSQEKRLKVFSKNLNNNFGEFKSSLNVICKEIAKADYIFQLDADEYPTKFLIKNIKTIIEANKETDLYYVPRINIVDGISTEHINEWKWKINEKGYINFPDYQGRIYKSNLKWVGKVHEVIQSKTYSMLPPEEDFCLYHKKNIDKQIKQNNFYKNII